MSNASPPKLLLTHIEKMKTFNEYHFRKATLFLHVTAYASPAEEGKELTDITKLPTLNALYI